MQTSTPDLTASAAEVTRLVGAVRDDQLTAPTPCGGLTVAGLLDHLVGLTVAFRMAARKEGATGAPRASADGLPADWRTRLPADWRTRLPAQLVDLAVAWREPSAWEGTAEVAGVTMTGGQTGRVALTEVVVHGWDLAIATGQQYPIPPEAAEECLTFQREFAAGIPRGQGLFGPEVPIADDAPVLDRLLGFTGRDPKWSPDR